MWKTRLNTWEECRNVVRVCKDAMRKATTQFYFTRDAKDNKKDFFKSRKRKTYQKCGPTAE